MTDETQPAPTPQLSPELRPEVRGWCEAWKDCLQNVTSQVVGQPHIFEMSSQLQARADSDVWYNVTAGGAVRGEMTLRLPAASATRLAQKFLGEPAIAAPESGPTSAEHKEALEELLRQVAGLAATALAATAGGEVQLHLAAAPATPSWSSNAVTCVQTRDEEGSAVTLEIQISPALAAELQSRAQPQPAPPPAPAPAPVSLSTPAASYRRLMDVGLDVKLRFGTRRMLLRDVLALSAGVVVELDNALHSPVELLLDGRLVAKGEVVIVDGKYGLRVTDVPESTPAAGLS